MKREKIDCVVWLEWPERCFRVDSAALEYLSGVVPAEKVRVEFHTYTLLKVLILVMKMHILVMLLQYGWTEDTSISGNSLKRELLLRIIQLQIF